MKEIIFRADDLGYSEGVNLGIEKTIKKGVVRTVGLIVNLEHSQEGYEMVQNFEICLGLHVNISYGKPVSDASKLPSLVKENGCFRSSSEYNGEKVKIDYDEVFRETEAQYLRFREMCRREPDYMEGHAVLNEIYFRAIQAVAGKYGIQYIPVLTSPENFMIIGGRRVHFWMESMQPDYDPWRTFRNICEGSREDVEVMICHPGFVDDELLLASSLLIPRVKEVAFLTRVEQNGMLQQYQVKSTTYRQLESEESA